MWPKLQIEPSEKLKKDLIQLLSSPIFRESKKMEVSHTYSYIHGETCRCEVWNTYLGYKQNQSDWKLSEIGYIFDQ